MVRSILCFGDSNTHGYSPSSRPDSRYDHEERWTGVLAHELGNGWRVIEEGLGGRTTVRDDPVEGEFRSGKRYLLPCLLSHRPLDVVTFMLGTNDLKARFNASAWDVAEGMRVLVDIVRGVGVGHCGGMPGILLIAPPPIQSVAPSYKELFAGAREKSMQIAHQYARIAEDAGICFLDAGSIVESSKLDGVHLEAAAHAALGAAVAKKVKDYWATTAAADN
jgi:lysophospholipase L1-like esterase